MNKILAFSQAKNMIKFDEDNEGKKDAWYFLTPQVQQFINNFSIGDEVEYKVNDMGGKATITFLNKKGSSSKPTQTTTQTSNPIKYVCEDCGATLKDNTYPTCFKCSQARREKEKNSPEEKNKQKSIRAQAIGHAVSRTLISLQGQVDVNNVNSIITELFKIYDKNIIELESK